MKSRKESQTLNLTKATVAKATGSTECARTRPGELKKSCEEEPSQKQHLFLKKKRVQAEAG